MQLFVPPRDLSVKIVHGMEARRWNQGAQAGQEIRELHRQAFIRVISLTFKLKIVNGAANASGGENDQTSTAYLALGPPADRPYI